MRVLIVEDETAASENLIAMLHEQDASIEILDVLESVQQVERWLNAHPDPDLIFMDIHLSDGLAFSLFDRMEVKTPIIFTTAYDQYALNAFSVNSMDYLLKPVKTRDLKRALDKFNRWSQPDMMAYVQRMMGLANEGAPKKDTYKSILLVTLRDKLMPVDVSEIACIYSTERKTVIYKKNGDTLPFNKSLDAIITSLNPKEFFRANKQYIVARDAVLELVAWFDNRLLVHLPIDLPEPMYVSKNRASEFKNWMMG